MIFVSLTSRPCFDRHHRSGSFIPIRWNIETDKPCSWGYQLSEEICEWLDTHCKGNWFEVVNRQAEISDVFITSEVRKSQDAWRLAHRDGLKVDSDILRRIRTTREIAFRFKSDAIKFKLTWI